MSTHIIEIVHYSGVVMYDIAMERGETTMDPREATRRSEHISTIRCELLRSAMQGEFELAVIEAPADGPPKLRVVGSEDSPGESP